MNFKLTTLGLSLAGIMGVQCLFSQTTASTGSVTTTATTAPVATETTEVKPPPLSISGQVDAYYRFSSAKAGGLTSYTPATNAFGLGMANIAVSKDMGKIGFMADMIFGPRAEATNYNDYSVDPVTKKVSSNSLAYIKQLYITYKPTDKIKFTLGNFMTFVGYELVEATNNFNYSMSYNYTNGPFHHTGLKADFALSDNFSLMAGVFQPTDFKFGVLPSGGDLNLGGQLGYVNGGFKMYLNALTGPTPFSDTANISSTILDLTTSYQVSPKVGLGLEITNKSVSAYLKDKKVGDALSWTAFSVYLNYAVTDKFILAGRYENMNDSKGATGIYDAATINAFTLSGNIKVDALTIIPEIRFDSADKELTLLNGKKSDVAFILAMTYKF
jgi:Putative beta-barrel porin-2, OmpL-like. bbp2